MSSAPHEIYLTHADLIERTLSKVCRRHSLYGADAEDFSSTARLHLIEDDYAVLRQFQERSSLTSYLVVVITRQFQDWRNARWGKWRPSAEAKRLGDLAIRLETLTSRDGLTLDEAHEVLRTHYGVTESRQALEVLVTRFPRRFKRSFAAPEEMDTIPTGARSAQDELEAQEAVAAAQRGADGLAAALKTLTAQDRLILKMRFQDNCQIADIARALRLDAKPLYRHIEKLLTSMRKTLEESGLTANDMVAAWSQRGFDALGGRETFGEVRPFDRSGQAPALTGGHRD
jgi:RNA polymerase sigma factor (sigma-70 family)